MTDQLLDALARLGTRLKLLNLLFVGVLFGLRLFDLATLPIFLISDEEQLDAFVALACHILHPPVDAVEALVVANRVGQADGGCAAIEY